MKAALALGALTLSLAGLSAAPAPADACAVTGWRTVCANATTIADQPRSPVSITRCISQNSTDYGGSITNGLDYVNIREKPIVAVRFVFTPLDSFGGHSEYGIWGDQTGLATTGALIKDRVRFSNPSTQMWGDPNVVVCSVRRVRFADGTTWSATSADAMQALSEEVKK